MIIAGTGHRPNKLGGYSEAAADNLIGISRDWLVKQQYKANFVQRVISGGALGWDQALAWGAVSEKIPLTLALPFPQFQSMWPKASQEELEHLVSHADKVVYVCDEGYAPWKMQERNQWMVDHCDTVLAMWNGTDGGTHNCIKYANRTGKPITNLWSEYEQLHSV